MLSFSLYLEGRKNPYVYHVTYAKNLVDIFNPKLMSRGGYSPWVQPHLNQHSEKGVFFCKDLRCAKNWVHQMGDQAIHLSDDPMSDELFPTIIRFKINRNTWKPDDLANTEFYTKDNYITSKQIDPLGIQVWDGSQWTSDAEGAVEKLKYSITEDDFDSSYPMPLD